MRSGARAFGAILAALVGSGILASVALGESCEVTIRWKDALYKVTQARFGALQPGATLSEATIPDCSVGGRCAPPEETIAAFEVPGVPPEAALLVAALRRRPIFLAPVHVPQLAREHPLHVAVRTG